MKLRPRKDSNLKESSTFKSRINRDTVDESCKIDNCDEHCKYYTGSLIRSLPWRDSTNGADDSFGYDIELDYSTFFKNDIELDYSTFLKNLRQNSNSGPDDTKSLIFLTKSRNTAEREKVDKVKDSTNITGKVKVKPAKHTRDVNISGKASHKSNGFLNPREQYFMNSGEKESNDAVFKMKDRKKRRYVKEAEKPLSPTNLSMKVEKINTVKKSKNITEKVKIKPIKDTRDFNTTGKVSHKSKGFLSPCEQSFLDFGEKESNDTVFKMKDRKIRREKEAEKRVCVTDSSVKVEKINTVKISNNITEKVKVKAAKDLKDDSISGRVLKRRRQSLLDFSVNESSELTERCLSDTKMFLKAEKINEVKHLTTLIDNVNLEPAKDLKVVDMFGKVSRNSKRVLNITNRSDQSFFNFGEKQSNGAVFATENGKKLKYEIKAEECLSDTEIYVMGDAPVCSEGNFTPFECNKQYLVITDTGAENTVDGGRSYFREEVMNIYKKPYDQDEYEQLLEAVKSKKPIKGRKNHRKSLLEHNADLKAELDQFFFDRPKMLNILRGFFYWLQNLSHEGIFKPWLDPACQAMKPMFKARSSRKQR